MLGDDVLVAGRTSITRFAATWLKAGTIAQLHRRHWRSGGYEEHDGQAVFYSVRRFEGAHITAVTHNRSQIEPGHQRSERCQECFFVRGLLEKYRREDEHVPIALDEVPPVVLSETIGDWTDLVNNRKYRYSDPILDVNAQTCQVRPAEPLERQEQR